MFSFRKLEGEKNTNKMMGGGNMNNQMVSTKTSGYSQQQDTVSALELYNTPHSFVRTKITLNKKAIK
jgi:hypothetical protein